MKAVRHFSNLLITYRRLFECRMLYRITSYNVCYTKLLRHRRASAHHQGLESGRRLGQSAVDQ